MKSDPIDMTAVVVTNIRFEHKRDSEAIARAFFERAKEMRLKQPTGDMPPQAFLLNEEHEYILACDRFFRDSDGKNKFVALLSTMADKSDAIAFVLIAEAWRAKMDKDEAIDKIIQPSKHPKRVEMVMVSAQYQCQKTAVIQAEIVRDKDGKVTHLVEIDIPEEDKLSYTGRFCNILGYPSDYKHDVIYCGKKPIEGETEPTGAKQLLPGDKVGLYWDSGKKTVKFLGWAHYEGDFEIQPPYAVHPNTTIGKTEEPKGSYPKLPPPYPCFRRQKSGDIIWGVECCWASETRIKKLLEGKKVVDADIEELRTAELKKAVSHTGEKGLKIIENKLMLKLNNMIMSMQASLANLVDTDTAEKLILQSMNTVLATILTTTCATRNKAMSDPFESLGLYRDCSQKIEKFTNKFLADFFDGNPPFTIDITSSMPKTADDLKRLKDRFEGMEPR